MARESIETGECTATGEAARLSNVCRKSSSSSKLHSELAYKELGELRTLSGNITFSSEWYPVVVVLGILSGDRSDAPIVNMATLARFALDRRKVCGELKCQFELMRLGSFGVDNEEECVGWGEVMGRAAPWGETNGKGGTTAIQLVELVLGRWGSGIQEQGEREREDLAGEAEKAQGVPELEGKDKISSWFPNSPIISSTALGSGITDNKGSNVRAEGSKVGAKQGEPRLEAVSTRSSPQGKLGLRRDEGMSGEASGEANIGEEDPGMPISWSPGKVVAEVKQQGWQL